jgi:hypothetical protein
VFFFSVLPFNVVLLGQREAPLGLSSPLCFVNFLAFLWREKAKVFIDEWFRGLISGDWIEK